MVFVPRVMQRICLVNCSKGDVKIISAPLGDKNSRFTLMLEAAADDRLAAYASPLQLVSIARAIFNDRESTVYRRGLKLHGNT